MSEFVSTADRLEEVGMEIGKIQTLERLLKLASTRREQLNAMSLAQLRERVAFLENQVFDHV